MESYYPVVCQAVAGPDRVICECFTDGKITRFDVSEPVEQGGVFAHLGVGAALQDGA